MDKFVSKDDAIKILASFQGPSFFPGDEVREQRLEAIGNDFSNNFLKKIT